MTTPQDRGGSAKRGRVRLGLRGKLTASHLVVGVTITLLTLLTTHLLAARDTRIDETRAETVRGATELASTVNSAFEEGFSSIVLGELGDREKFTARLGDLRTGQRRLLARSDVTPDEARALREMEGLVDTALRDGRAMFASTDQHEGKPTAESAAAFDTSMDRLRDHAYAVAALITKRASADDAESQGVWDRAVLGIGLAAALLALGLGRILGGRLAKPILNLRDAARAFARGETPRIDAAGDDEIGELSHAFARTASSVQNLVVALTRRNADSRLVLDNVNQGLFTVDAGGLISPEHSAALGRWFGAPKPREPLAAFFGRVDADFGAIAGLALEQVLGDFLPTECTLPQMPERLVTAGQHYHFDYTEIPDPGARPRFLVVVTDVTRDVERDAAERERRELLALFEQMLADRSGVLGFLEEASELVATIGAAQRSDTATVARALHTLKGNSAAFGLENIAALCHELERRAQDRQAGLTEAEFGELSMAWTRITEAIDRVLGRRERNVEMTMGEHRALLDAAESRAPHGAIERMLRDLRLEPTARPLQRFAEQARALAERLGKQLEVTVEDHGLRIDESRYAKLWSAFVHAVRNAVDHGIEDPETREAAGKAANGRLWLRTRLEAKNLVIEVEDDGRGIDFEAVRTRCRETGRPSEMSEDLVRAILGGGISTAASVTELSGRGIGVSALAAATDALGGRITFEIERTEGTLLRLTFPPAPMDPEPGVRSTRESDGPKGPARLAARDAQIPLIRGDA